MVKVKLPKDYKKWMRIYQLEQAKIVIDYEKNEDEYTAKDWAEYAINEALKHRCECIEEILKVSAEIAGNCRIYNAYGDTGEIDVWIEAIAKTSNGFIEVGAYLTDIWDTGAKDYREHEYIRYYSRKD